MIYAYKELDDEEVEQFRRSYINASAALINIDSKTTAVFKDYQIGMTMTCVTEVEDAVPKETIDTIEDLR